MAPTVMVTTRKRVRSCQAINLGIVLLSVVLLPLVVAVGSESGPADPVKTESGGNSGSIPPPAPAVPEVGGQQSPGGLEDPPAQGGSGVGAQQAPIGPKDSPAQGGSGVGAQQAPIGPKDPSEKVDPVVGEQQSSNADPPKQNDPPKPVNSLVSEEKAEEFRTLIALADRIHETVAVKVIFIFADQIKTKPTGLFVANLLREYEEIDKATKSVKSAAQIWKDSTNPSDEEKVSKEIEVLTRKWNKFEKHYPADELYSKLIAVHQNASDDEYKLVDQLIGRTFQLVKAFKGNNQDQVNQIDSTFQEFKSKVEDLYTKYHGTGSGVSGINPQPAGCCGGYLPASLCARICLLSGVSAVILGRALWYSPAFLNWAKNQVGLGPSVPETTEMDPTTTTELSITDSPSEASEFWIIVAVVALIAALAVAFYCFVVRKRTSSSQDTEGATASDGAPTGKTQLATGDKSTQAPVTATPSTGTSTTPSGNVKSKTGAQRSAKASPSTASSGAITSSKASAQEKPKSIRATSSKVPSGTPKA